MDILLDCFVHDFSGLPDLWTGEITRFRERPNYSGDCHMTTRSSASWGIHSEEMRFTLTPVFAIKQVYRTIINSLGKVIDATVTYSDGWQYKYPPKKTLDIIQLEKQKLMFGIKQLFLWE